MDLFISDPTLTFEQPKTAAAQLDEDPAVWPKEILAELFRQVPEASEYVPRVMMYQVDEEQGYGFGAVVISSMTDSAMGTSDPGTAQKKQVLIPIIIKSNMLMPLDLLLTQNKMRPFTGTRLREALFRPSTFELMTKDWGDQSLYNLFYPPGRSENDFASGVSTTASGNSPSASLGSGMKTSSKTAGLLTLVGPTINKPELDKLAARIGEDPALQHQLAENVSFRTAVAKLASFEGTACDSAAPLFKKAEELLPVHVAQFGYDGVQDRYWVKTSSRGYAYRSEPRYLTRKELLKFAGEEVAQKIDTEGTVTVSEPNQSAAPFDMDASEWATCEHPGVYRVQTTQGAEMVGWVFPQLIDFDGVRVPMSVFTNGAAASVQGEVAGSWVGAGHSLPTHEPQGTGVFYMRGPSGLDATVPVTIVGREAGMDGAEVYHIKTLTDGEYRLKIVPGLRKMLAAQGDDLVMMPEGTKFMKLDQENSVALQDNASMVTKTAEMWAGPKVKVWSDGLHYGLGFEELPKMAQLFPSSNVERDEAAYALCLMGVDPQQAQEALTKAAAYENTTFVGVTDVRLAAELVAPSLEEGKKIAAEMVELRQDMLKVAAVLPDIQTVDSVLSLGFINPENVRIYVGHLPYLERALTMVCELTLASRLGLSEVPEFAAARATRALNEVTEGLRALALREIDESSSMA